jgi:radical SAM superfamily enzyme YgiQ (UPF0313 family)
MAMASGLRVVGQDAADLQPERAQVVLVELSGERGYLPLAVAYLGSYVQADDEIGSQVDLRLVLDHCQADVEWLIERLTRDGRLPDVIGFSCQGWSIRQCDAMARAVKAAHPGALVVYGGNHVSHQGAGFMAEHDHVDVLVNGEGEDTFREVLRRYLADPMDIALEEVLGVTFRSPDGSVRTNPDRARIKDLDVIPSPYLSGLLDEHLPGCGTVMLETNRGCPYKCSFCYWGQATGQRLHRFSYDRLKAEMRFLVERGVDSWYVCDANFGILPQDATLVDEIVRLRTAHGFPRTVHTNWAKNSNARIVDLCARLNKGGVHSTYTLALQSTTPMALEIGNRANMKSNRLEELATLCRVHGVVPRGELIWGMPGETFEDFLQSYDDLSEYTDALSVYPLYVLPNTEYGARASELGIVTLQAEEDTDYRYCVQHAEMSYSDYLAGLRFIVSSNISKVGGVFLRVYPRVARTVAGIPYHQTVGGLGDWIMESDHPVARRFRRYYERPLTLHRQSLTAVWLTIARDRDGLVDMFESYLEETIHQQCEGDEVYALRDALKFDIATYPVMDSKEKEQREGIDGAYVGTVTLGHDVLSVRRGGIDQPTRGRFRYEIRRPAGLWRYPVSNWYFGLVGYEGRVTRLEEPGLAAPERVR